MKRRFWQIIITVFVVFGLILSQAAAATSQRVVWEYSNVANEKAYFGFLTPTETGTLLVSKNSYRDPKVLELNDQGEIIWEYGPIQANSAYYLKNGNLLIADSGAPGNPQKPRVIEVTKDKEVVWSYELSSRADSPRQATELAGGNILIVGGDKVMEVNRSGKIVWQYRELLYPNFAQRLDSGNTLIVDRGFYGGKVLEVNPQGKVVWSYGNYGSPQKRGELNRPVWAKRQADGSTLVADRGAAVLLKVTAGEVETVNQWLDVLRSVPVQDLWVALPDLENEEILLSITLTSGRSVIWRAEKGIETLLKGKEHVFATPPIVLDGILYAGAREVMGLVGAKVNWKAETKELELISEDQHALLQIDQAEGMINGKSITISPPRMLGNTAILPLAFVKEYFGLEYNWDAEGRLLKIL
ncbi:MAG: copper amine oxidase N-terminal domain-containing protein [Bacillota bacterium]